MLLKIIILLISITISSAGCTETEEPKTTGTGNIVKGLIAEPDPKPEEKPGPSSNQASLKNIKPINPITISELKPETSESNPAPKTLLPKTNKTIVTQQINEIRFEKLTDKEERLLFFMEGEYNGNTFALEGERPRVVCDFFSAGLAEGIKEERELNGRVIKKIRVGVYKGIRQKVRIVLDLTAGKSSDYEVQPVFFDDTNIFAINVKQQIVAPN